VTIFPVISGRTGTSPILGGAGDFDLELLQRVVDLFLKDACAGLSSINDAITRSDSRALEHAAHKLKGAVANFHARAVVEAAQRLEKIGRGRDLSGALQAAAVLENEMKRLQPALIELGCQAAAVQVDVTGPLRSQRSAKPLD
jgi:HPt (histidine-containing phosphotransfer) domain-containing protein